VKGFFDADVEDMLKFLKEWDNGEWTGDEREDVITTHPHEYSYEGGGYVLVYNSCLNYAVLYAEEQE
jgi:hypothetical protein